MMDLHLLKQKISNITPTNRNPLYQSHLYWSQKPFNITDLIIEELTKEGDVVLDPFMGSGVTIFESVLLNRKAIGVEINELPIFIVKTLLKNDLNLKSVKKFLLSFENFIDTLNNYYTTKSESGFIDGNIKKVFFDRETPFSNPIIKEIYYKTDKDNKIMKKQPDENDVRLFSEKNNLKHFKDYIMIPNSRLAVHNNQPVSTLFTARTINILDEVLNYSTQLKDEVFKDIINYIVMSSLHLIKITDLKSNSQWPLWTPKTNCVEKNAVDVLKRRTNLLYKSIKYIHEYREELIVKGSDFNEIKNKSDYMVIHKGAQDLTENDIPDHSVDLVVTDPPYLGQVLYSEYMQLYYPFLNFEFNLEDEIVVSNAEKRNKNEQTYFSLLEISVENIAKKLKKGKMFCMYFHDSNLSVWNKLIEIMKKNGLHFLGQAHISKKKTLKNILSPKKSLQGDSILFFINEQYSYETVKADSIEEIVNNVVNHAEFEIKNKGALSTTQLLDEGLMEYIIQNDWIKPLSVKYKSIVDIFEPYLKWNEKDGKWHL